MYEEVQLKFVAAVLHEFRSMFASYRSTALSASEHHFQVLSANHTHMAELRSHVSCFCCFMRMPEKVLACGHALCDPCIKIYGPRVPSKRNTHKLSQCILCGVYQNSVFRFVPPTAGIRTLSVDGGGVRGIIPLTFLRHLDVILTPLGCPIQDYFDFVCGTSAGGLVVIGLFLLQWDTTESLQRFEEVASKTFGKRKAFLNRILQVLIAYVKDGQYSLASVQDAFQRTFNCPLQMFNPLRNDTKVAVTTTAVGDSLPWLFTNYNGGKRSDEIGKLMVVLSYLLLTLIIGYDVVRASDPQQDITVSDA